MIDLLELAERVEKAPSPALQAVIDKTKAAIMACGVDRPKFPAALRARSAATS